ncbi:hypothetical protein [Paraburkholderia sp. BR14374]|uniref:hypothetical protein n=1 Tax=Paraburkholderia sp. BR14374 TaxID=3237007 RepID=UPI0034CD478C
MANRSVESAKGIKALISDSASKIERGTSSVANARQAMENIVASVNRVSDMTQEITASAVEQ